MARRYMIRDEWVVEWEPIRVLLAQARLFCPSDLAARIARVLQDPEVASAAPADPAQGERCADDDWRDQVSGTLPYDHELTTWTAEQIANAVRSARRVVDGPDTHGSSTPNRSKCPHVRRRFTQWGLWDQANDREDRAKLHDLHRRSRDADDLAAALRALIAACPVWMSSGPDASPAMTKAQAILTAYDEGSRGGG